MTALPFGWAATTFEEIADLQLGKMLDQRKNRGEATPYLRNVNVRWGAFDLSDISKMPLTAEDRAALDIRNGDVLVCEGGEPGRAAVWTLGDSGMSFQKALIRVRAHPEIDPNLLAGYLRYAHNQGLLESYFSGTTIKHLPQAALSRVPIELPPANEQRRIVAKLDGLLSRTARARKELDRIPKLVTRYKKLILAAAFAGDLTSDWRLDRNIAQARFVQLRDLCRSITDGDHQAPPRADTGVPFITISAMNDGRIRVEKASRFVPPSYAAGLAAAKRPAKGDVLFSVTGSIAIPAVVETEEDFVFQRHIAILKPDADKTSGRYLALLLAAPQVRAQAEAVATGTAQLTVPLSGLRLFQVPNPTIDEQAEIVRRIESAFAWLDTLAAEHACAAALLPKLEQALLTKAFRGELVQQDPDDEPALTLLERIRAARAAAPVRKRKPRSPNLPRAGQQRAAMTKSRLDQDVMHQPYLAKHLRDAGGSAKVEDLFRSADLPVADFYKQLAWEVEAGHVNDQGALLEAA